MTKFGIGVCLTLMLKINVDRMMRLLEHYKVTHPSAPEISDTLIDTWMALYGEKESLYTEEKDKEKEN